MTARALRMLAASALLLAVASVASPGAAADIGVTIEGTAFKPASINIAVGDTVNWTNLDGGAHTVTSNAGVWESGTVRGSGGTFSRTFDTAGTFEYFCQLHSWMLGTVVVRAPGAPIPTPTRAAANAPPTAASTRAPTPEPVAVAAPTVAIGERTASAGAEGAPGPILVALAGVLIVGFLSIAWLLARD